MVLVLGAERGFATYCEKESFQLVRFGSHHEAQTKASNDARSHQNVGSLCLGLLAVFKTATAAAHHRSLSTLTLICSDKCVVSVCGDVCHCQLRPCIYLRFKVSNGAKILRKSDHKKHGAYKIGVHRS